MDKKHAMDKTNFDPYARRNVREKKVNASTRDLEAAALRHARTTHDTDTARTSRLR